MATNTRVIRIRREHAEIVDAICLEHECSQTRAFEMLLKGELQPLGQTQPQPSEMLEPIPFESQEFVLSW